MQDVDRDGLPLPVRGSAAANSIAENKVIVAVTITALILAGSAVVYHTCTHAGWNRAERQQATKKVLVASRGKEEDDEMKEGLDTGTASEFSLPQDLDSKEGKNPRSKDRRRRGKDPLKDLLKSEKKLKGFPATTIHGSPKASFSTAKRNHHDEIGPASHASSSTSLLSPDSRSAVVHSVNLFSRSSGKRAQREFAGVNIVGNDRGSGGGSTSGHSSNPSEVSQSHSQRRHQDQFDDDLPLLSHASGNFSNSYTELHSVNHPYSQQQHHREDPTYDRPPSSLASASDDGHRNTESYSSTSSRSQSRHTRLDTDEGRDLEGQWLPVPRSFNQAPRSGLAEDEVHENTYQSSSHTTITAVVSPIIIAPIAGGDIAASASPRPGYANLSSASSSISTETTTTTSSSLTRATSPTLSQGSGSSKLTPTPTSTSDTTPSADPSATPLSLPKDTPTMTVTASMKSKNNARKAQPIQPGTSSGVKNNGKSKSKASPSPWDWDGAGDGATLPTSSFPSLNDLAEKDKDSVKEKETYKRPPRLQSKGTSGGYSSFSVVTSGGASLAPSSSHLGALYSPSSPSFASSVFGGVPLSTSVSTPSPTTSASDGVGESAFVADKENEDGGFTFPTLNPPKPLNDANLSRNHEGGSSSTPSRGKNSRRPPTPSHKGSTSPPPHASTSSGQNLTQQGRDGSLPTLSTQTQLASLRGALEAARLREEKNKMDVEKYVKELEVLRWESMNSRRGEAELQAQVRHLMHQLQTYAALFSSMAPQMNAQQQQRQANGTLNSTAGSSQAAASNSPTPNRYPGSTGSSSTAPSAPQHDRSSSSSASSAQAQSQTPVQSGLPPHLHLPMHVPHALQMNGMASPGGLISPMGTSPFFPYALPPHTPPYPHPLFISQMQQLHQMQQQTTTPLQSPHSAANFFSMFPMARPPPPGAMMSPHQLPPPPFNLQQPPTAQSSLPSASSLGGGSGPPSAAGTSSTGSMSPDLNGSPRMGAGVMAMNGKLRARTRTQTLKRRVSGRLGWEDVGNGWVAEREEGSGEGEDAEGLRLANRGVEADDDEDRQSESEFNVLLADAILKRPGSIRSVSKKGSKKEREGSIFPEEDKGVEQDGRTTEFTFPSLSDLGNVYSRSASRMDHATSSSSSLLPSSSAPGPDLHAYSQGEKADIQPKSEISFQALESKIDLSSGIQSQTISRTEEMASIDTDLMKSTQTADLDKQGQDEPVYVSTA